MAETYPVRKRPDGYDVHSFDDRYNVVAGCDFATRVKILFAVETALELVPEAPEYPAMEESFCVWAYLTILRQMMIRRELPWRKAVDLVPYDEIPPIFRRVDLRRRFMNLRRRLHQDVIERGTLVASQDLHALVIASFYPRTPEGSQAAHQNAEQLRCTSRPVLLPGGLRYHTRTLWGILDYYGLARRGRTKHGWYYRVHHGRLQLLTSWIADTSKINLEGLYWMRGRYRHPGAAGIAQANATEPTIPAGRRNVLRGVRTRPQTARTLGRGIP